MKDFARVGDAVPLSYSEDEQLIFGKIKAMFLVHDVLQLILDVTETCGFITHFNSWEVAESGVMARKTITELLHTWS